MFKFILDRVKQICDGGLPVFFKKTRSLIEIIIAIPLVLAVRALRPFVLIRFGGIQSARIGHFAMEPEVYLCERDIGNFIPHSFDFFHFYWKISNSQLAKMWKRKLSIYSFVYVLSRVNKWLPGYEAHEIKRHYILNIHGILAKTSTHLSFTPQEDSLGREAITKLGVPEDADFVCFLARDQVYLNTWLSKDLSNPGDCEYLYRNSSIHNYLLAMEELTKLGYYVFRMGAIVEEPLKTNNQMIIDYAIKYRSEFLDIYLSAKCSFFVIDTAGLGFVPVIFRRPIAFTNIIPLEHGSTWHKDSLWLPKKLWHKNERRFLSFYEILELGAAKMNKTSEYQKAGLEIVENTSDEIADLVMEMDMRLKGTWYPSEEDEDLQQRFNTLIKQSPLHGEILARIGAKFLHQNRDLL